ncbi:uncharacterized protein Tco025E_02682 [Trypanosoma conorhini]|uniref:Uncharacterized protein n=1 Tax=Trypanosoma conorhini TaxID=83891 RepID=A0A422Q1V3_9TRYP|nr:uncharacterized protein Tco025E_02682 [Trypanosoma conorhini]RNF23945.1 hypothetical protein Tco025E_02682 [Trypanosoma conorhini]
MSLTDAEPAAGKRASSVDTAGEEHAGGGAPAAAEARTNSSSACKLPQCEEYPAEPPPARDGSTASAAAEEYPASDSEGPSKRQSATAVPPPGTDAGGSAGEKRAKKPPKLPHLSSAGALSTPHTAAAGDARQPRQRAERAPSTVRQKRGQHPPRPCHAGTAAAKDGGCATPAPREEDRRRGESSSPQSFLWYFTDVYMKPVRTPRRRPDTRHAKGSEEGGKTVKHEAARAPERKADDERRAEEYPVEDAHNEETPSERLNKHNNARWSEGGDTKSRWVPPSRGANHLSSMSSVKMSPGKRDPAEETWVEHQHSQTCVSIPSLQARRQNDAFQRCLHVLLDRCNNRSEKDMVTHLGYSYSRILALKRGYKLTGSAEGEVTYRQALLPPPRRENEERTQKPAQRVDRGHTNNSKSNKHKSSGQQKSSAPLLGNGSPMKQPRHAGESGVVELPTISTVHEPRDEVVELGVGVYEESRSTRESRSVEQGEESNVHCSEENHHELLA